MPQGVIALSPWTDLSTSGESVDRNRDTDRWLSRRHLESWSQHYAGSCDRREPLLSPVFAELHALPPLLLLVGEHEVLLDDALRVASRARLAGTQADLHIGRRMQHDWPLTLPWLEESRAAWDVMRKFIDTRCAEYASPTDGARDGVPGRARPRDADGVLSSRSIVV